jgi:hypothetical protein
MKERENKRLPKPLFNFLFISLLLHFNRNVFVLLQLLSRLYIEKKRFIFLLLDKINKILTDSSSRKWLNVWHHVTFRAAASCNPYCKILLQFACVCVFWKFYCYFVLKFGPQNSRRITNFANPTLSNRAQELAAIYLSMIHKTSLWLNTSSHTASNDKTINERVIVKDF